MTPKERAAMQQAIEFIVDCEYGKAELALRGALAEQAEQEPVATIGNWGKVEWAEGLFPQLGAKLYAAPVRTKDLTDEDVAKIKGFYAQASFETIVRAAIAADREKNK